MKKFIKSKKIWFAFITVFVSGVVIGAVAVFAFGYIKFKNFHGNPAMAKMRILSHMNNELELTPEQKVEAEKIMTKMSTQLHEMRKEQYPKFKEIITNAFSDIEKLLDENQKVKFKEMREKMKKWHRGHRSSRHGERGKDRDENIGPDHGPRHPDTPKEENNAPSENIDSKKAREEIRKSYIASNGILE